MNILKGTREEKLAEIQRMTNADLFDNFDKAAISRDVIADDVAWEYSELGLELERRLQRVGFLPDREKLLEIRRSRMGLK